MSLHQAGWSRSIAIGHQLTLSGYSRSSYRTGFRLDELGIYFDAGLSTFEQIKLVLITHGHGDHIFALGNLLMTPEHTDNTVINILTPEASLPHVRSYAQGFFNSNYNKEADLSKIATFTGVRPRSWHNVQFSDRIQYSIQVFKLFHTIPTVGYGLNEVKKKLNPKLEGLKLSQQELTSLIKSIKKKEKIVLDNISTETALDLNQLTAQDISVEVTQPIMVYLTDTSIKLFTEEETHPQGIYNYPTIVVECTFYKQEDLQEANKKRHIHWNQLEPYIRSHPKNHFILIHSSLRYVDGEIRSSITRSYPNLTVWLENGPYTP